jgi:hypothetical protein
MSDPVGIPARASSLGVSQLSRIRLGSSDEPSGVRRRDAAKAKAVNAVGSTGAAIAPYRKPLAVALGTAAAVFLIVRKIRG